MPELAARKERLAAVHQKFASPAAPAVDAHAREYAARQQLEAESVRRKRESEREAWEARRPPPRLRGEAAIAALYEARRGEQDRRAEVAQRVEKRDQCAGAARGGGGGSFVTRALPQVLRPRA